MNRIQQKYCEEGLTLFFLAITMITAIASMFCNNSDNFTSASVFPVALFTPQIHNC